MARLTNRVQKLENALPQNVAGIIVYMENVKSQSYEDENGNTFEKMTAGDFRMHNEDTDVLTLEEMQAYIKDHGHTYVTFMPVEDRFEDVQLVEVRRDSTTA